MFLGSDSAGRRAGQYVPESFSRPLVILTSVLRLALVKRKVCYSVAKVIITFGIGK